MRKAAAPRCSLRRRTRQLPSDGTWPIATQLTGVSETVTAARQPRSVRNWLRMGAGASLLADAAAGQLAISRQPLEDCP
jgi:hypothetical protein